MDSQYFCPHSGRQKRHIWSSQAAMNLGSVVGAWRPTRSGARSMGSMGLTQTRVVGPRSGCLSWIPKDPELSNI